jgi:molecular chaperone GrpE (heat shock protein)
MFNRSDPKLSKWPFMLGDVLLLGAGYFIFLQSKVSMGPWQIFFIVLCVAGGAWLGVLPFLLEYRLVAKLAESDLLTSAVAQMRNLETLATQISSATGHWQQVQDQGEKSAALARELTERMNAEVLDFTELLQRAEDREKLNLRLEVEKLRRGQDDWLQVLVRMLDHVYALNQGAVRSGQASLIAQMGNFQNACRDAARRVGLTPFVANVAEPFDAQRHQCPDGEGTPPTNASVAETLATGYTFQGKLLRLALVRLQPELPPEEVVTAESPVVESAEAQSQLELVPAGRGE